MTHLEFNCSDEKTLALIRASRLYDEGAELEPVKHARWLGLHDGWYYSYSCSECGAEALTKKETMHDQVCSAYCPNCGARMDGDGE